MIIQSFTLGILIVTGGFTVSGMKEMIKSPLLWAIFLGFFFNVTKLSLPSFLISTCRFAGEAAPPLAAFALGGALVGKKLHFSGHLLAGLLLRFFLGFFSGVLAILISHFAAIIAGTG